MQLLQQSYFPLCFALLYQMYKCITNYLSIKFEMEFFKNNKNKI
jgi:hypothetical protein